MLPDEEKPPIYWEGVRDALRLLADFVTWKEAHPESALSLAEYLSQAEQKVSDRLSPRLLDMLGIPFK